MGPISQVCNLCWKIKKVVLMVVSYFPFKLMNEFVPILFTGLHRVQDPSVKEEPKSPSTLTTHKQKVFSTTDSSAIRYIASSDLKCVPVEGAAKHQKTGPSPGRLDAVATPPATRKSTCASKFASNFNSKKDIGDLFCRLGQEFEAVTKTFKEIAELME